MTSRYYSQETQTLTLPPPKAPHARNSAADTGSNPTPAFPLYAIVAQPWANSLRSLVLRNRTLDMSFSLPELVNDNPLPNLEELDLHNCGFMDRAPISWCKLGTDPEWLPRVRQEMLPLIVNLFPNLQILDLSENRLRRSFSETILRKLLYATDGRRGLKCLRLRGNKLQDLNGLRAIASSSFDASKAFNAALTLEELDVSYNDIVELPPGLGVLPLKRLSVEGNA